VRIKLQKIKPKKRILYILHKKLIKFKSNRQHTNWIYDCLPHMHIDFWGKNIDENISITSLKKKIDRFKPDYIYMTIRRRYEDWLPDITSIKVPKIFVEMDTWHYSPKDPWYNQFDILKCRCPWWNDWKKVPFFQWSVPEKSFPTGSLERKKRVYFIGQWLKRKYPSRVDIKKKYGDKIRFYKIERQSYWDSLHAAGAVICPTESVFGDFIPSKLFEYVASGAAVITNCNLKRAGLTGLHNKQIIPYKSVADLNKILDMDFVPYHNQALEYMREHTHAQRYKGLFK